MTASNLDPPARDPAAPAPFEWLLGRDARTRARVAQAGISFIAYALSALVMGWGVVQGIVIRNAYIGWVSLAVLGAVLTYAFVRSPRSQSMHDAVLTEIQVIWGIFLIVWGYAMCGPWRTATLFPMMMAMTFGAMTIPWQRLLGITVFGIVALAATIAGMVLWMPDRLPSDLTLDLVNLAFITSLAPCATLLSVRFGLIKTRLIAQRRELKEAMAQIHAMATQDGLTGLYNRRHMSELIAHEHARAQRARRRFSIALIDIDHFKRINDTWGHARGDHVLQRFAQIASEEARKTDSVARWGGEEFLILAPESEAASCQILLERIRTRLRDTCFEGLPDDERITVSVGIATSEPGEMPDQQIERADQVLYQAKGGGRDRIVIAPAPGSKVAAVAPITTETPGATAMPTTTATPAAEATVAG